MSLESVRPSESAGEKDLSLERREEEDAPEFATEKIQDAEKKIDELIVGGQMQIDSIERSVNLPAEDLATVREEIGLLGRLETIGDKTSELLNGLKEKFLGLLLKKDNREASTKTGGTK